MLVASVTYYFSLLDLGYGNGVVRRHIVEADTRGDTAAMNRVVSTFMCVYAAIGVAACVVCALVIAYALLHFPNLSPSDVRTAQIVLAILGGRIALGYPMTVFGAVTNARQGFVLNNSIAMAVVVLNAVVTYVVLTAGGGPITLVSATAIVSATGYIGYAWSAWHVFPELEIHPRHFSRQDWRDVTMFSTYLFIIGLGSQISFNVDNLVIGAYLGTAAVAVYAVAARVAEYQRRVCDQFSGMMFPVVVGLGAQANRDGLRTALVDGTRVSVLLVVGVTTCLVGFAQPLIVHWMGAGFEGSVASFCVLAMVGVLMVSHAAQSNILLATGGHRLVALILIVEAIANLALSLILVEPLGAVGVALGTAIPMFVGHVFVMTPTACRRVGLTLPRYLGLTVAPALASAVPAVACCVAIRMFLPPTRTTIVLVKAAAAGALYAFTVAVAGLDRSTRRLYCEQMLTAFRAMRMTS